MKKMNKTSNELLGSIKMLIHCFFCLTLPTLVNKEKSFEMSRFLQKINLKQPAVAQFE